MEENETEELEERVAELEFKCKNKKSLWDKQSEINTLLNRLYTTQWYS